MSITKSTGRTLRVVGIFIVVFFGHHCAMAEVDFSNNYERIYQIRVLSPEAGSKSSIGSGFQVSADGLIVTNYHVVSQYVNAPENHNIEYVTNSGDKGLLELLDFDVIADLAVLRHPNPAEDYFTLNGDALDKGHIAHALGNPGDWGIIMVSGATNGFVEHSYEDRVLFSGSLNAGMSGGPSLNDNGEVIGINVATAGSQLSFLVPAKKAVALLARAQTLKTKDYQLEIAKQLKAWQRPRIQELIDKEWPVEDFGGKSLFGEIRHDIQCWGSTNESKEDREIASIDKNCQAGDDVYLAYNLNAGQIVFHLHSRETISLNDSQFAQQQITTMWADNASNFDYSTNYRCESDFIETDADTKGYQRVISCIRAYKKLPGLYDSLLLVQHHESDKTFKAHLSLSALEHDQIKALHARFLEASL